MHLVAKILKKRHMHITARNLSSGANEGDFQGEIADNHDKNPFHIVCLEIAFLFQNCYGVREVQQFRNVVHLCCIRTSKPAT